MLSVRFHYEFCVCFVMSKVRSLSVFDLLSCLITKAVTLSAVG